VRAEYTWEQATGRLAAGLQEALKGPADAAGHGISS
jgi:hypothetical protein